MQKDCWRCIIMNGMKPKFLEGKINSIDYYETPNPYVNAISSDIDLLIYGLCGETAIALGFDHPSYAVDTNRKNMIS